MARPSPQTDRVVALVGLLASSPDATITLAEATRRLRVNKSTCHSMLTALTEHAWLLRDPVRKTYRLGPALVARRPPDPLLHDNTPERSGLLRSRRRNRLKLPRRQRRLRQSRLRRTSE